MPSSEALQAHAYAMPASGWSPLTVYFSAFGSLGGTGSSLRYEWDLDGNGRYDTDSTQSGGYVSYLYKKPGDYTITLKVTDELGNSATDQVSVRVRYPGSSSVDYWTIFDDSQVQRVEVHISQENWDMIWQDPSAKVRVETDISLFGEELQAVAVSLKGNASMDAPGEKKSWKVDINYYLTNQEFHNLKQLLFNNNYADASLLRDKMAYDMMAFAGVPAGHASFVEFWVDIVDDELEPEYLGIYTMVERVDSKFVSNRFDRDQGVGNLYKADGYFEQGAADLAYYGESIEGYPMPRGEVAYGLQTNLDTPDYSGIINLCRVIDGVEYASTDDFASALEEVFNVDGYLRYLAVIFTNLNLDTYPYTGNNFYLYENPAMGWVEFLPWDLNNSWGHFGGDATFPLYGKPCCMGPLQWAPLFTKVLEVPEYRQDYAAYVDLLLRHWFNAEQVSRMVVGWQALLAPHLTISTGDRMFVGPDAMFTLEEFSRDGQDIITLTAERAEYLRPILASGQWRTDIPEANIKPVP